jgi:hypothetical protein
MAGSYVESVAGDRQCEADWTAISRKPCSPPVIASSQPPAIRAASRISCSTMATSFNSRDGSSPHRGTATMDAI